MVLPAFPADHQNPTYFRSPIRVMVTWLPFPIARQFPVPSAPPYWSAAVRLTPPVAPVQAPMAKLPVAPIAPAASEKVSTTAPDRVVFCSRGGERYTSRVLAPALKPLSKEAAPISTADKVGGRSREPGKRIDRDRLKSVAAIIGGGVTQSDNSHQNATLVDNLLPKAATSSRVILSECGVSSPVPHASSELYPMLACDQSRRK